jgi:hypothetical protein
MEAKSFDQQIGEEIEAAAQLKECQKCGDAFKQEIKDSFKAGMEKVVEFVQKSISIKTTSGGIYISGYIAGSKWQAFLKENDLKAH